MNSSSSGDISSPVVCNLPSMISMAGIWKGESPLDFSFPLFLLQLLLIVLTTRAAAIVLEPLQQPRYLAEIIGGLLLGPSVLGRIPNFASLMFPLRSILLLETMANLGLIYFTFITGIEIDRSVMRRSSRSVGFVAACIGAPFAVGVLFVALVPPPKVPMGPSHIAFLFFICINLSITAFSVLARSLAELKLLNSALGTTALTSSMLVNGFSLVLTALAITIGQSERRSGTAFTVLSGVAFYVSMQIVAKPAVHWVINQTPEGEEVDDMHACVILVTVLFVAFLSDALGLHAISGSFLFGLLIPNGPLGEALIERIEDFVEGLLLPLFFTTSGLKVNFANVGSYGGMAFLSTLVVVGTVAKVGGCVVAARLYDMPAREGVAMGLLMNVKGVIEMVLLNVGRDRQLLDEESFSALVSLSIILTAISTPLLRYVVRPDRRLSSYTRRTVQWPNSDAAELRVVVCLHNPRNVPTAIAIVDAAANPSKRSPITVFALHLIELTSRASAMIIINTTTNNEAYASNPLGIPSSSSSFTGGGGNSRHSCTAATSTSRTHSDHIMQAFESYEQHTAGVSVHPLTAVSPYVTMHRDICGLAEENQAALILLPFHKQRTVDGSMEVTIPAIRSLNQNVLGSSPCSVAILIDRGLQTAPRLTACIAHHVTLLFLGGPDDREAVAIASRMAEHPGVSLTLVRFVAAPQDSPKAQRVVNVSCDEERERQMDDDCVGDFRLRYVSYKSVAYVEKVVCNAAETVVAIRTMLDGVSDLYIVGRGRETESPLTAGLTDWSECPELGALGELLASEDFGATVSVLVVQQCREKARKVEAVVKAKEQDFGVHSTTFG